VKENLYPHILKDFGWTQVQAAKLLGINERTSRRYASGETKVPLHIIYALLGLKFVCLRKSLDDWGEELVVRIRKKKPTVVQ
jgi:transcriptional regulator with XRE-family HTH domain